MTLDNFDLLKLQILSEFCGILQILEPTAAKQMKIGPYCQQQNCSPLNVRFGDV